MKKKDSIIFFNISLKILFSIIFDRSKEYIYLEKVNKKFKILKLMNQDLKNLDFETSKVFLNNRNIHYIAEEKANKICKEVLQKYIKKNKIIISLNKKYKKNTLNHFIQKKIYDEIKNVNLKILISNYLIPKQKIIKLETKYSSLYKSYIKNNIKCKIEFTNKIDLFLLFKIIFYLFKISFFKKDFKLVKKKELNILSIQEEKTFENFQLRSQPHWINKNEKDLRFNIIKMAPVSNNQLKKLKNINFLRFRSFLLSIKNDKFCVDIINDIKIIIRKYKNYNYLNIKLLILDLLTTTIHLKSITNSNQIKIYLYQESNTISSSANIISGSNYLKTIEFQYSHLQTINPVIKSNSDYYLSFSKKYKSIFSDLDVKPNKIIETGCLRENYLNDLKIKNRKLSNFLNKKFKICFFDESFEDRWGLISRKELKQIYKKIFNFLEKNDLFVLITKPQFKKASLNNLFKKDKIYEKLIDEKRIIDLQEDLDSNYNHLNNRNTILTLEAAQLSDICISFKYGATAGLESAFIGKRVVLFDFNNFKSPFDNIYNKSEICFKNFDKMLNRINIYQVNSKKNKRDNLGNWNKIIKIFTNNNYMKKGFGTKNYFRDQIININNEIDKINNNELNI